MANELDQSDVVLYSDAVTPMGDDQQTDPVRLLRRVMRGRLWIAAALMLILGAIGAFGGYTNGKILYRSMAQVYVRPNLKPILHPSDNSQIPPMFSSYVRAQVSLLQSPDTMRLAIGNLVDEAKDRAEPEKSSVMSVATQVAMRDGLRVVHRTGEEVIDVWFVHEDPVAAEAATEAVLAAFTVKHEERRKQGDEFRITTLQERVAKAKTDADVAQREIDQIASKYGTSDLTLHRQSLVESSRRLRLRLEEIEEQSERLKAQGAVAEGAEEPDDALSLGVLALQDPDLARLVSDREAKQAEIESMGRQYGPEHLIMRRLRGELETLNGRIESRRLQVELALATGGPIGSLDAPDADASLAMLQRLLDTTTDQLDEVNSDLQAIYRDELRLRDARRALTGHLAKYEEADAALDRVMLDEIASERVGFVQTTNASTPSYPYSDKRRAYAILGGGGGAGLGLAIVVGWGLLNRQYRYIEDLEQPAFTAPLLGCLPDLAQARRGFDEATAWSIHQIRNLLQAKTGERDDRGNLYAITSPQSGDGKTSLALALAISMAKSGKRTLVVDLDLVGRGLTKQLKLEDAVGVRETILAEHVNGEISQTEVPGLSVLPAGRDTSINEANLSSSRLKKIIWPLTDQFDAVIVDTGPVLGSLESSLICGLADGVLVTISRGQSEALVEQSLQRVRWLGADCVGLVFNRATQRDLRRSHSHSASMSLQSSAAQTRRGASRRVLLASAVGEQDATRVLGDGASRKRRRKRAR